MLPAVETPGAEPGELCLLRGLGTEQENYCGSKVRIHNQKIRH